MRFPLVMCAALVAAGAFATSCLSHEVEVAPIEVKPIHVTVDVNVRVQRELDEFFDYEQRPGAETGAPQQQPQQPQEGAKNEEGQR